MKPTSEQLAMFRRIELGLCVWGAMLAIGAGFVGKPGTLIGGVLWLRSSPDLRMTAIVFTLVLAFIGAWRLLRASLLKRLAERKGPPGE